jgi:hypothetical protein
MGWDGRKEGTDRKGWLHRGGYVWDASLIVPGMRGL